MSLIRNLDMRNDESEFSVDTCYQEKVSNVGRGSPHITLSLTVFSKRVSGSTVVLDGPPDMVGKETG